MTSALAELTATASTPEMDIVKVIASRVCVDRKSGRTIVVATMSSSQTPAMLSASRRATFGRASGRRAPP